MTTLGAYLYRGTRLHPALKELRVEQEAAALWTKWSGRSAESMLWMLWVGRERPHSFTKEKVGRRKGKAQETSSIKRIQALMSF